MPIFDTHGLLNTRELGIAAVLEVHKIKTQNLTTQENSGNLKSYVKPRLAEILTQYVN